MIAAESIVPPGKKLEGGWLYAGAPARPVERVTPQLLEALHEAIRQGTGGPVPHVVAASRVPRLRHAPGTGVSGSFGPGVYVAPTASVTGRVELAPRSSLWFGVEVDAGEATVRIGEGTNVQDNSRVYGGRAGQDVIIGMGALIGDGSVVRSGACVAAGSITEPSTEVAAGHVWSGRPARAARPLSDRNRQEFSRAIEVYVEYAANYLSRSAHATRLRAAG